MKELKLNELRCGNTVNYFTEEGDYIPTVIDWQHLKWLTEDPKGFNLVHLPIQITDEWLLEFGLIKKVKTEYQVSIPLEYIHELQNLYFDLTGHELKTKI